MILFKIPSISTLGPPVLNKRGNVGDKERDLILQCYNQNTGKKRSDILALCKAKIVDAGVSQLVVQIYLESPDSRVTTRIKNIVKQAIQSASCLSESKGIDEVSIAVNQQMKYAEKRSPTQRKNDAVRDKLRKEFNSDSESDSDTTKKPAKKRKLDKNKEAQEAHTKMCEKAMETMDRVNCVLDKVEKNLDKIS